MWLDRNQCRGERPVVQHDGIPEASLARAASVSPLGPITTQLEALAQERRLPRVLNNLGVRALRAQEDERKSISRELHDQLGQSLSAILLTLESNCPNWSDSKNQCRSLEGKVRQLIEDVRQLAWNMRPSILDDYGLDSALANNISGTFVGTALGTLFRFWAYRRFVFSGTPDEQVDLSAAGAPR